MPPPTPEEEIANLRTQITELQSALASQTALANARPPSEEIERLRRQLEEAQGDLAALRASPPAPSARRTDGFFEVDED